MSSLSEDFTPRNVAKFLAVGAVKMKVTSLAKEVMTEHSRFDEDSIPVRLGSQVVGAFAAYKARPYTDRMVDEVSDRVIVMRVRYQDKKNKKNNEKQK